jgi:hypothetical protein
MPILEASADKRYGDSDEYKVLSPALPVPLLYACAAIGLTFRIIWPQRYKSETSILVPLPPSLYATLPVWLKTSILLDLPIYNNSAGGASSASGGYGRLP